MWAFFSYDLTFKSTGLQEKVNNCWEKPARRWLTAGMGRRGHWKKWKGRDLKCVHESSLPSPPPTPTSQTVWFVLQVRDLLRNISSARMIYFCIKVTLSEPSPNPDCKLLMSIACKFKERDIDRWIDRQTEFLTAYTPTKFPSFS